MCGATLILLVSRGLWVSAILNSGIVGVCNPPPSTAPARESAISPETAVAPAAPADSDPVPFFGLRSVLVELSSPGNVLQRVVKGA
jgi:hypothetical protein